MVLGLLLSPASLCVAQGSPLALKDADALYQRGSAAFAKNDLETALVDFQKVVRLAPTVEQGHSALGLVLLRLGRASESIPEFEKALALKHDDAATQLNLATAYQQTGQSAKEIIWLERIERADKAQRRPIPASVAAMYARALAATNKLPAAVVQMKLAVAAEPENTGYSDNLGSLYAMQKDWPNAEQSFRAALSLDRGMASAHLHLGLALQAQQRSGSSEELAEAYRLDPENPAANLELGRALAAAGDDGRAMPLLQHAHALMPQSGDASYQLGLALQRSNRAAEAIPLFKDAAAVDSSNADLLANYGMALCQQQKAAEALPLLTRAAALAPDNPTVRQNLAAAYIQLNQFDDAVVQLRAAIKLSPESPQLHYNLGLAFKMQDDEAAAMPELEMAEKLNPSASEPPYALGMLHLQAGRYADAARELNASLKLQPENGDAWATLGSVYNHLDKLPEAAAALGEAVQRQPLQPDPHLTLAAVLVKENKPAEAAIERKRAAELMRANMNRQRAEVACHSGTSLLKDGKVAEAIVEFRSAIGFDASLIEGHLGLADALDRKGETVEAAAERQQAASLQSKMPL